VDVSAYEQPWHRLKGEELSRAVVKIAEGLWNDSLGWRGRCKESLGLFEGRRLPGLAAAAYMQSGKYAGETYDRLTCNLPRSLCLTAQAKLAARQRPKPQFMVTGGDWDVKRRAKRLDRFVEAQMHHTQGCYEDAWEIGQQIFLDGCVFGLGGCKVWADLDGQQCSIDRVFPWEILVDPMEARFGNPRNMFHRYGFSRDELLERYADDGKVTAAIKTAKEWEESSDYRRASPGAKQVTVYEAWVLPGNKKSPGRHVICIDGCILEDEEWDEQDFPFVFIRWTNEMIGFYGTSLVEEVAGLNEEMNHTLQRMQEAERKCSNGVFVFEEGSIAPEALESNDIGTLVAVAKGAQMAPNYFAPSAYAESTMKFLNLMKQWQFELSGISEMSATSRKETGVTAGVALRTLADLETERFAVVFRQYEQFFTSMARRMVAETRKLAEEHKDFAVKWAGGQYLATIDWEKCNLADDQYQVRIESVGSTKNTPADRAQLASELLSQGMISPQAYQSIIGSGMLDTPGEMDRNDRWRRWVEKQVESWLDTEDGDEAPFEPPIKFMPLEQALLQVAEAYADALLDGAPEANREPFTRFMEMCDRMIKDRVAQAIAAQQAAGPAPAPPNQEAA